MVSLSQIAGHEAILSQAPFCIEEAVLKNSRTALTVGGLPQHDSATGQEIVDTHGKTVSASHEGANYVMSGS